jgi:hypothetical protein
MASALRPGGGQGRARTTIRKEELMFATMSQAKAGGLLLAALCLYPVLGVAQTATDSDAAEGPATILADQVRQQGHNCEKPVAAQRDPTLSRPEEPVWILDCGNATYRVTVRADMAAEVEEIAP